MDCFTCDSDGQAESPELSFGGTPAIGSWSDFTITCDRGRGVLNAGDGLTMFRSRRRIVALEASGSIVSTSAGFRLPMERVPQPGFSGGPVLAPNDEIVGIHKPSTGSIAGVIPATTVRKLLDGALGVRCESRALGPA